MKRHLADLLSSANFCCGLLSIYFAYRGEVGISLLCLLLGALFDGLDGIAARRFGGTRLGVFADDIADGVNYGLAPGFALYFSVQGKDGLLLGLLFSLFTVSRLVYFTLSKQTADPNYFSGVPSTVGGSVVLASIFLLKTHPALLGFMVGVACIQMISFDTLYRHLGRLLAGHTSLVLGMAISTLVLAVGGYFFGFRLPIIAILTANLVYGFLPVVIHFRGVIKK